MAERQRQSERMFRLPGEHPRVLSVFVRGCSVDRSAADESTKSQPGQKMSTGGHFKHIIITFYHASAAKALCVYRYARARKTQVPLRPQTAEYHHTAFQVVYFASSGGLPNER